MSDLALYALAYVLIGVVLISVGLFRDRYLRRELQEAAHIIAGVLIAIAIWPLSPYMLAHDFLRRHIEFYANGSYRDRDGLCIGFRLKRLDWLCCVTFTSRSYR